MNEGEPNNNEIVDLLCLIGYKLWVIRTIRLLKINNCNKTINDGAQAITQKIVIALVVQYFTLLEKNLLLLLSTLR